LRLQKRGSHAPALADDRSEDDGTVDLSSAALARGGFGIGEDLRQIRVEFRLAASGVGRLLADEGGDVVAQAGQIHRACFEDMGSVGILGQRQQQMLERDDAVRLADGILRRPRQCRHQRVGHGSPADVERCLRHIGLPLPLSLSVGLRPLLPIDSLIGWLKSCRPMRLEHDSPGDGNSVSRHLS
jgi:hypothetical protein